MFTRRRTEVSPAPSSGSSEVEKRQRHRLSKPMTNKSSTNLRLHALQQENTNRNNSTEQLPPTPLSPQPSSDQPRELIKAHIFESVSDLTITSSLTNEPSWKGTTFIVSNIEAAHSADHLPLESTAPTKKSKRPFSAIFGSRPSPTTNSKSPTRKDNGEWPEITQGSPHQSSSPATSSEDVSDAPPIRAQRRSSFNPGEATRPEKTTILDTPITGGLAGIKEHPAQEKTARFSFEEDWAPPPRIPRTETPTNLECTHLGGLRLGSLQIMNGRASPAPSALSTYLIPRNMPTVRRDTSSEYGDFENTGLPIISNLLPHEEHSKLGSDGANCHRVAENAIKTTPIDVVVATTKSLSSPVTLHSLNRFVIPKRRPVASPDKTSLMAMAYMAELADSPYSERKMSSPTGSVIVTTVKATELDDRLFDDETMAPSVYSEPVQAIVDIWSTPTDVDSAQANAFRSTMELEHQLAPQKLQVPEQYRLAEKSDSGYSSNVSTYEDSSDDTRPTTATTIPDTQPATIIDAPTPKARNLAPRLMRPRSILKQNTATAPELPTFSNLQLINSPASSTKSVKSVQPPSPSKPKKLQKHRRKSQVIPVEQIMVQGAHLEQADIPPIPAETLANLSIRTQQVPELEQTFNSMHHTRHQPSISTLSMAISSIRFPSPGPELDKPKSRPRSMSFRRQSFIGPTSSEKRMTQQKTASGISEADAMSIIRGGFGNMELSLGSSPYDAVPGLRPSRPGVQSAVMNLQNAAAPKARPKSMMDDQTAAELARLRSRAAFERENAKARELNERRSFNDRGGIPGKNLRPASISSGAPPLPPMPNQCETWQRGNLGIQHHDNHVAQIGPQEHYLSNQESGDYQEISAPMPPKHSPRPAFVEPANEVEDISLAPPPPSHSPQPMILGPAEEPKDAWAAQAQAWASRRLAARMLQSRKSIDQQRDSTSYEPRNVQSEPLYPTIPPRNPQGIVAARINMWEPRPRHHHRAEFGSGYTQDYDQPIQRSLPVPSGNSYWAEQTERPQSRASQISNAASLAESLHPADMDRPQPPPQFGRYSGGLDYGYERKAGFGGSAGTRGGSGKANAARKGVPLRAGYGIDLGDIPIIAGLQRI